MKTQSISAKILFTFAFIMTVGIGSVSAQSAKPSMKAVSINEKQATSSAKVQVGIHALEASSPKFLIGLVNHGAEPVTIRLKDSEGRNIHKPIFFNNKSLAATFDMSHMQEGTYTIEVKSKSETYRYHIQLDNKVMRTVEINPTILAGIKK